MGRGQAVKVVVTGAAGLLGWHCAARLHAANCTALHHGEASPFSLVTVDRETFQDQEALANCVKGADAVLHFAGVNRGEPGEVESANPAIAQDLLKACAMSGTTPHIVYANSTHAQSDTAYGRSKRIAGELLANAFPRYTNLILPHIFGECARPHYNNVTATLIDQLWNNEAPTIDPEGSVNLLHAGKAAEVAIDAAVNRRVGVIKPDGHRIAISELYDRLAAFHLSYSADVVPHFADEFELALFNSYRTGGYPAHYPKALQIKGDHRGILFETSKAGGSSQSFISTTLPGKRRGDHFHLDLVERFVVISGRAVIRIRRVLTGEMREFLVDGDHPVAIDMPPLHTHHIENLSQDSVITFFWSHRLFDPANPDTFADPVQLEPIAA